MESPIAGLAGEGPYAPAWNSLLRYDCPEWYRDAKFAIWNHWSRQCVPEDGDWYARNLYEQGSAQKRLYGPKHPCDALPDVWDVKNFYDRTRDLVDQHDPDVLYLDNSMLPRGWGGLNIGAYFYNRSFARHGGKVDCVMDVKDVPGNLLKAVVADVERGLRSQIAAFPWQSQTCIGEWHYHRALYEQPGDFGGYMHPREAVRWLIDTVSKNGAFVLNIPGKPDGTIDRKETLILEKIGAWLAVNGEGIYATRPWKVYAEGAHRDPQRLVPRREHRGAHRAGCPLHAQQGRDDRVCVHARLARRCRRPALARLGRADEAGQDRARRAAGVEFAARVAAGSGGPAIHPAGSPARDRFRCDIASASGGVSSPSSSLMETTPATTSAPRLRGMRDAAAPAVLSK